VSGDVFQLQGEEIVSMSNVTIRDAKSGSTAKVLVGFGFNCYQFTAIHRNEPVELLWAEPGYETGKCRASGGGIPIMFPFAGRIPGTVFRWDGRDYHLAEGDGRGNAIHGFVMSRPWRITAQTDDSVTGQFHASVDDPALLECWPADFRITCTYRISGTTLDSVFILDNPDDHPLPYGFGTHGYLRLSLGGADSNDCIVRLPVTHRWELTDMLPTGRRLAVPNSAALQSGAPFRDMTYDDIFTGLQFQDDWCTAAILDPRAQRTLKLQFDRIFRECIVYTPPHREAICIEPETCVPNAFDLSRRGLDAGPTQLPPGCSVQGRIRMELS
jgi:aldose 1-epimerase